MRSALKLVALFACFAWTVARPATSSQFRCPQKDSIAPCTCKELHAFSYVRCAGQSDHEVIRQSLRNKFTCKIPWLRLTGNNLTDLGPAAFSNISITRLLINGSMISGSNDDVFLGQEGLEFLVLQNDDFDKTPKALLSKLLRLKTFSLAGNKLEVVEVGDFTSHPILAHLVLSGNAIRRVDKGAFPSSLRTLALSDNKLTTLNHTVLSLNKIEWLLAGDNHIASIEGQLEGLNRLQLLNLAGNSLSELGDAFRDLSDLRVLNLGFNQLKTLGNPFYTLGHLKHLNLSGNRISGALSGDEFSNLTHLQLLDLSGNGIVSLGDAMMPMKSLLSLNLSQNSLTALPHEELQWLRNLRDLDVSHNRLITLDDNFGRDLSKMVSLILADNHLESLHGCLKHLHDLQELDLSFNHLTSLERHDIPSTGRLHHVRLSGNPWVCDGMLTHTLHDLDTRLIQVDGRPTCSLGPDGF